MRVLFAVLVVSIFLTTMSDAFMNQKPSPIIKQRKSTEGLKSVIVQAHAKAINTTGGGAGTRNFVATALGYVMGSGAMLLYTPMVFDLIKSRTARGYSAQTWVFNLLVCPYLITCAILYSTYLYAICCKCPHSCILGFDRLYCLSIS
jgi:hypothetical protein